MKAINYFIVIRKIKEAAKKVGGLELTEDQNKDVRYLKAEVVTAGDKIEGIKAGDIIHYDKHAGHGIEFNNNYYFVIKHSDVVIVH